MKKTLSIHCILFAFLFMVSAQWISASKNNPQSDTSEKKGVEKLESLKSTCTSTIETPDILQNALKLKEEALKQKNDQYTGHAYLFLFNHYRSLESKDSIVTTAQRAKEYYQKANDKDGEIRIDACLIDWNMQYGNIELALNKTLKLLQDTKDNNNKSGEAIAYELLGRVYLFLNKADQALEAFEQMLKLKREYVTDYEKNISTFFWELATATYNAKKHDLSLTYSDSLRFYAKKYPENSNNIVFVLLANINSAKNLTELDRITEAKQMIENIAAHYNNNKTVIYDKFYYYAQATNAEYYLKTKDYNRALLTINKVIDHYTETSDKLNLKGAKDRKADILAAKGDYKNAFFLKNEVALFIDSLAKHNASRQIDELRTIYEVDRLKDEAENHRLETQQTHTVITSLAMGCTLLFIIAVVTKYNSNQLKKKNKKIFAQHKDLDIYLKEINNLSSLIQDTNPDKLKEASLFEKTTAHLYKTECFRNPNLTRESLALELGTNRQYLTQAIQENKEMTFTEYINGFRLEYARRLLSQEMDFSIDKIYTQAGFNNKSTFYRLFKQKYDLTPKEMREIAQDEKTS